MRQKKVKLLRKIAKKILDKRNSDNKQLKAGYKLLKKRYLLLNKNDRKISSNEF